MRRRVTTCHALGDFGIYVEPFESAGEITAHWPRDGVILVEDEAGHLPALVAHMAAAESWLPERPSAKQVAQAILDGAVGYLDWPLTGVEVIAAIAAAEETARNFGSFKLRQARARGRVQKHTPREREVLSGITEGLSNRQIGERDQSAHGRDPPLEHASQGRRQPHLPGD
jgi:two-component system response regulator FixJ